MNLSDDDVEVLKLLSRNYVPEGEDYLDRVVSDLRATIVGLADRIANLKDLLLWVNKQRGFNPESSAIAYKYLAETEELISQVTSRYPEQSRDLEHPIRSQLSSLRGLVDELEELFDGYLDSDLVL